MTKLSRNFITYVLHLLPSRNLLVPIVRRIAFICLGIALTGCVRYQPQPLSPAQSEASYRARTLADEGLHAFVTRNLTNAPAEWPPQKLDLPLLTLTAFYFNPEIEAARLKIGSAQADEIAAGERPNPTVSILPEYSINPDAGVSPWVAAINFDVPIETAGKRKHRISQAQELTLAARLGLAESAWKVRSNVRAALVEKLIAERELLLLRAEAEVNSNRVSILAKRVELGEAARFDLNLAEMDLLNAQLAAQKSESRIVASRLTLASALGLPSSAVEKIAVAWTDFETPPAVESISSLAVQSAGLLNRLDVRRALKEYAASEADLHLQVANQYPDLHLSPGYQFDQGQHKFALGPTLNLPILNQNQGGIAKAQAKRQELAAAFSALQMRVVEQTEKAFADYRAALSEWNGADRVVRALQTRIEDSMRRAVELGEVDRLTLYNVHLQRSVAARARLDALLKAQAALGALEDAVQRPISDSDDLRAIESLETTLKPAPAKG